MAEKASRLTKIGSAKMHGMPTITRQTMPSVWYNEKKKKKKKDGGVSLSEQGTLAMRKERGNGHLWQRDGANVVDDDAEQNAKAEQDFIERHEAASEFRPCHLSDILWPHDG